MDRLQSVIKSHFSPRQKDVRRRIRFTVGNKYAAMPDAYFTLQNAAQRYLPWLKRKNVPQRVQSPTGCSEGGGFEL